MLDNAFGPWTQYYRHGVEISWKQNLKIPEEIYQRYTARSYGISPVLVLINKLLNSRFQKILWTVLPKRKKIISVDDINKELIRVNMLEIWSNITRKTQVAIKHTLTIHDYGFLVRGNATLYIDNALLRQKLATLPNTGLYAGPVEQGKKFVSGWCIIMSRDVAEIISAANLDSRYFDDEAIGIFLQSIGIEPVALPFMNVLAHERSELVEIARSTHFIFRFKGESRNRMNSLRDMEFLHIARGMK